MNFCIVFSVENSDSEPNFEKMSVLLANSIRDTMPNVDVFCGMFTNRNISEPTLKMLKAKNVTIIEDEKFIVDSNSINFFLRNYTKYYFTHEMNLLEDYDYVLYVDIDVIFIKPFNVTIPNNSIIVEEVPEYIKNSKEKDYIGIVSIPLYYNWYDIITNDNKHIFDINYKEYDICKTSDIVISKNITNSSLELIPQTVGAYYPKHGLNNESQLFHYDGFIDSGYFYKLKDSNEKLYKKYCILVEKILKIKITNIPDFWDKD